VVSWRPKWSETLASLKQIRFFSRCNRDFCKNLHVAESLVWNFSRVSSEIGSAKRPSTFLKKFVRKIKTPLIIITPK
jgi:hypothetical protein